MKYDIRRYFLPSIIVFAVTLPIWIFNRVAWYQFFFLFLGLFIGSVFIEVDHLIYWFFLHPELEESQLALTAWKKKDFKSLFKLFQSTHHQHTSLIFHHYFFQIILTLISFFIFTSTPNIFIKAFTLATGLHLLLKEYYDYRENPEFLKSWLFAREKKQLPTSSLQYYLYIFATFNLLFTLLLIFSQ